jgi:hypothetical protein
MLNRSEILTKAWADYRRDASRGWGVKRGGPFDREHFAYCLRMAWALSKERASAVAASVKRRCDLIQEAGILNNHPDLVSADHVTIMGMMDTAECERHVARLRSLTAPSPPAATVARAAEIRSELRDMEFGDFIPWTRRSALTAELAKLNS